jgi:hypothetical protein
MTIWALLFGLSHLARYHPDVWVKALNPDRSRTAVPLEQGMEATLRRSPELLSRAVGSGPISRFLREHFGRLAEEGADETGESTPGPHADNI